ncbi:hypothetical protein VULLAG_LOCUS11330 [Vulpes lagopus]
MVTDRWAHSSHQFLGRRLSAGTMLSPESPVRGRVPWGMSAMGRQGMEAGGNGMRVTTEGRGVPGSTEPQLQQKGSRRHENRRGISTSDARFQPASLRETWGSRGGMAAGDRRPVVQNRVVVPLRTYMSTHVHMVLLTASGWRPLRPRDRQKLRFPASGSSLLEDGRTQKKRLRSTGARRPRGLRSRFASQLTAHRKPRAPSRGKAP